MPADSLNAEFARLLGRTGWTQAEAARQLHLSRSTVSLYLKGRTRPSVTVIQLFKLLAGDVSALPPARRGEGEPLPLEDAEAGLLQRLRALPAEERRALVRAFAAIAGVAGRRK